MFGELSDCQRGTLRFVRWRGAYLYVEFLWILFGSLHVSSYLCPPKEVKHDERRHCEYV